MAPPPLFFASMRKGRAVGHRPLFPWPLDGPQRGRVTRLCAPLFRAWHWLFYSGRPDGTTWWRASEWGAFHSEKRFLQAIFAYLGPPSHLLWNLKWPMLCLVVEMAAVLTWDHLRSTCCPQLPTFSSNGISETIFRLCSFALSLVLSFRLRSAYARWWDARVSFAGLKNAVVTLTMQAISFVDDPWLVREIARWGLVWQHSIFQCVTLAPSLEPEGAALLDADELAHYTRHAKPRFAVYSKVRLLVAEARLSTEQFQAMEASVEAAFASAGACARLRFTPMPYGLTLFTTGFVLIWLALLPGGSSNAGATSKDRTLEWLDLFSAFFMALLMLSVDELANQLEDPWALLPLRPLMEAATGDIRRALEDAEAWGKLRRRPREAQGRAATSSPAANGAPPAANGLPPTADGTPPAANGLPPPAEVAVTI